MRQTFLLIIIVKYVYITTGASMDDTKFLLTDLFKNYSKEVRPASNQDNPISVQVTSSITSINDFDEVDGVLSVGTILYVTWRDESLIWNPKDYGNLSLITINQKNIWLPQMYLANAAEEFEPVSNKHFKVSVMSDGTVLWKSGGILKFTCTPDVSKFPFDKQTCRFLIIPWGYSHTEVSLSVPSSTIDFTFFNDSVEWIVTGSSTELWIGQFDIALFYFNMERRPLNFLVNVVLPIILLSLVNPFVFILPYNSGERASYSITVLLSFSVYMTVVSDRMPASSAPMSYLSYYLFCMLALSVIIVEANLCQMRTYNKNEDDEPIPQWVRSLVRNVQGICRSRGNKDNKEYPRWEEKNQVNILQKNKENKNGRERLESGPEKGNVIMVSPQPQAKENKPFKSVPDNVVQSFFPENEDRLTWHIVGKNLDKIYFILFQFLNIICAITFFTILLI